MNAQAAFRVAVAGLDPRDARLIEIVFRHSQYNRFQFRIVQTLEPEGMDLLVANTVSADGLAAVARLRSRHSEIPVIAAVPRGATSSARYSLSVERLTLQLLPILNRVVENEIVAPALRIQTPAAAPAAPAPASATPPGAAPVTAGAPPAPVARATPFHAAPDAAAPTPTPGATPIPAAPVQGIPGAAAPARVRAATPGTAKLVEFPRNAEWTGQRIRVLVVDDSPTVRQQLSIALNRMGLACDAVDGAAAAHERLRAAHYDLALVDVVMRDVDGYRLTREIRSAHRATPVIILTSKSSPFDLARGALAGCKAYLVKPVPLRKLEAAVTRILRKSLAIDDLASLMRPIPRLDETPAAPQSSVAPRRDEGQR